MNTVYQDSETRAVIRREPGIFRIIDSNRNIERTVTHCNSLDLNTNDTEYVCNDSGFIFDTIENEVVTVIRHNYRNFIK